MLSVIKNFTGSRENCVTATDSLLQLLKVKVTGITLEKTLQEHPNYPSLLSVTDALTSWKIETLAIKVAPEKMQELPLPFMTQVKGDRHNYFAVVNKLDEGKITWQDPASAKWKTIPFDEFNKKSTGIVLLAEPLEQAGEKDYKSAYKSQLVKSIAPALLLILLTVYSFGLVINSFYTTGANALFPALLFTTKLVGVLITSLLLWYEFDKNNPLLQKICTGGSKTNCNAILQSKAAKAWGEITWSDLGFIYFTGGVVVLALSNLNKSMLSSLAWFNLLALPYIVYSLYYQGKIAKQWCRLCLGVQALLALEFIIASGGRFLFFEAALLNWSNVAAIVFSFLGTAAAWFTLKSYIVKAKNYKRTQLEFKRLKYNPQLFEALLHKQKAITHDPTGLGIVLGNPNAKMKIIKVCNPYCGPCASAHPIIDELIHLNEDVQVQIIFTASEDENDRRSQPVKHLLALNEKQDAQLIQQAMDDWYNNPKKDYETFAKKYLMNGELQKQGTRLQAMHEWSNKMEIAFTPTFFINGYQLPEFYSIQDLKNILAH
ncbi:vitamin K epoxide reductase family protein [Solitalea lacus]|uniref:vitamin K epoxide reductase family protein n=1 Tax=Solitalea lacus TaxID=2911172 RepID=UPI001EDB250C|nr:vitamin K epoxide reductase family protein [Solitalea lacus]UKJ07507.1 thioredoxin domain-containing protein [Solitalea lacus]